MKDKFYFVIDESQRKFWLLTYHKELLDKVLKHQAGSVCIVYEIAQDEVHECVKQFIRLRYKRVMQSQVENY